METRRIASANWKDIMERIQARMKDLPDQATKTQPAPSCAQKQALSEHSDASESGLPINTDQIVKVVHEGSDDPGILGDEAFEIEREEIGMGRRK